jgi:hypothetical protein
MSAPIIPHLVHTMGRRVSSQSPSSVALATQRIDQTPALSDILCKRKRRLSSLLNAHSLALSVIKRAISFGLNLHGPGYDILRSPLCFSDYIASRGLRLSYDALSFGMRYGNSLSHGKQCLRGSQSICWQSLDC